MDHYAHYAQYEYCAHSVLFQGGLLSRATLMNSDADHQIRDWKIP